MDKEKKYLLLNWILLISYGCINSFAFYSSVYCWPTQGSIIWLLLIIFCPPFLYHLVFIGYTLSLKKMPHSEIGMPCCDSLASQVMSKD